MRRQCNRALGLKGTEQIATVNSFTLKAELKPEAKRRRIERCPQS
jgi:hypothetical protein